MPFFAISFQILTFLFFSIALMYSFKEYGVLHPLSWFPIFFFLYAFAFPVYQNLDNQVTPYTFQLVPISFLALIGFSTPLMFLNEKTALPSVSLESKKIDFLWTLVASVCVLLILYVFKIGVTSKREFLDNIGGIGSFFVVFTLLPIIHCMKVVKYKKIDFLDPFFYGTLLLLLLVFGVTGERDYLFRYLLFLFLIYFTFTRYKVSYLLAAVFLSFIVMPFTQVVKGYLISENGFQVDYDFNLQDLFYGEFFSAGRNLHYILEKNSNFYYGETLIWDLKRFLSFIFPSQQSTGAWFNDTYRVQFGNHGESGWGFSLVAEGYLNFYLFGVFFIYFIIGMATYYIYKMSSRNIYYFIYYLMYVVVVVYVTRSDLANYLSSVLKINLFFVFLIFLIFRMMKPFRIGSSVK